MDQGPGPEPRPDPGGGGRPNSVISSIHGAEPADIWAVGSMVLRWDGSEWRPHEMPDHEGFESRNAVEAVTPDDAWIVGNVHKTMFEAVPRVEHWDGDGWTRHEVPSKGQGSGFDDVDAVSSDDVWAAGTFAFEGAESDPLIEHWDGETWSIVPSPQLGPQRHYVEAVDAVDTADAWVVGSYLQDRGLVLHWDGETWKSLPRPEDGADHLFDVSALSRLTAWAVGLRGAGYGRAVIERWDGRRWAPAFHTSPVIAASLRAVEVVSPGEVWAAGWHGEDGPTPPHYPLKLRVCPVVVGDAGFRRDAALADRRRLAFFTVAPSATGRHVLADATGLDLFRSRSLAGGSTFQFQFPGAGRYEVADAATGDTLQVTVPLGVRAGPDGDVVVRWRARPLPSDLVHDVEMRRPRSSRFEKWMTGTRNAGARFSPDSGDGVYAFRSRVRSVSSGSATAWSPRATWRAKEG